MGGARQAGRASLAGLPRGDAGAQVGEVVGELVVRRRPWRRALAGFSL